MRMRNGDDMIQIKDLVKVYGKGEDAVKALKGLNTTLPNTGLVFILGKSGCGKSTLLNMLGGLDDLTDGDIIYNGTSLAHLSEAELDTYRNNYVGIIYQNFNLFNNETVYQNILLAAKKDNQYTIKEDIENILEKLMLKEKRNTLVKNLSGGQKQRVAIARALIKESQIILADEPTGNLDVKNTIITFDILKEVAKDRLIIVVSHDNKSALKYADRIIYLSDGQIVDDQSKNDEYQETDNTVIEVPQDANIPEEEIEKVNETLLNHKLELRKNNKRFLNTENKDYEAPFIPDFKNRKKNITSPLTISNKFFKSSVSSFIVTVILITIIIALLAFAKNFIMFDEAGAISVVNEEYGAKTYLLNKDYSYYDNPEEVNKDYLIKVTDEDIQKFYDGGYSGNIYKLYNVPCSWRGLENGIQMDTNKYDSFYASSWIGVAVVDKNYLTRIFGDIKVLAGSLYNLDKTDSVIVTDYFADCLLTNDIAWSEGRFISDDENDPYQKIVNTNIDSRYKIGAIIYTGYKETYQEIIDLCERINEEPQNKSELEKELKQNELVGKFAMEADNALNVAYSINPNFHEVYTSSKEYGYQNINNIVIKDKKGASLGSKSQTYIFPENSSIQLSKGEVVLSISYYNSLFGGYLSAGDISGFEEQEISIEAFRFDQNVQKDVGIKMNLKVVGVFDDNNNGDTYLGYFSYEDYQILKSEFIFPYALIFENVSQCYTAHTIGKANYFFSNLKTYSSIFTICDIIDVFEEVFTIVFIVLIAVAAMILVSHNVRLIKKNQYLIGVYKSLGYPSSTFIVASFINAIYLNIIVYLSSTLLSFITNKVVNKILTVNFAEMMSFPLIKKMELVGFSFPVISVYIAVMFGITLITLVAPILRIKKLKPNAILHKAVE